MTWQIVFVLLIIQFKKCSKNFEVSKWCERKTKIHCAKKKSGGWVAGWMDGKG